MGEVAGYWLPLADRTRAVADSTARQGGVPKQVTVAPDGRVTAR